MVRARVAADAQAEEGLNAGWFCGPPQVPLLLLEAANPQVVAGPKVLVPHSLLMVLGSVRPKQAQLAAQATWTQVSSCATLRALEALALGAQACIRRCCHHYCWLRQQLSLEAIELFDAGPATGVANSIERLLRPPLPMSCTWL